MLIPGCTVTVRSSMSSSRILFISFTSTTIPCLSGTAPSVSPVPPARGTTGMRSRLASFTTSEICSAEVGSTTASGANSSQRCTGKGEGTRARLKRAERPVKTCSSPQIWTSSSRMPSAIAVAIRPRSPQTAATSSIRSTTSTSCFSPCSVSGRSDQTQAETSVSISSAFAFSTRRRLISAVRSGRSIPRPAPAPGAVRPLGDVVDVLERQARDGPQDLARLLVDALALVQPAGVVVGRHPLDRLGELELALADQLGDELDDEDDLEVVVLAEVARVVLGEGDVVVRVEDEDPLRADRAPVGDVVLGEAPRLVDVAHLRGRPAAAPLLLHEAELDARLLEDLRHRARDGRAVERRLAVAEEDGLAADRQVEALRPSRRRAPARPASR